MAKLELGVLDVKYTQAAIKDATGKSISGYRSQQTSTGEVAEILETNYAVMGVFYEARKEKIGRFIADSLANAFQDRINGRTVGRSPAYDAEQKIEAEFRAFLDSNEMSKLSMAFTGQPISAAAQAGVSHRKKHPYAAKNRPRPAFVDTGLYRASFRALFRP